MTECFGEALGGLALIVIQIGRDHQLENDVLIPAPSTAERRQAAAVEHRGPPVLRASRHLDGKLALQGRDEDLAAHDRRGHRHFALA